MRGRLRRYRAAWRTAWGYWRCTPSSTGRALLIFYYIAKNPTQIRQPRRYRKRGGKKHRRKTSR